jgi:hypothetical protein
MKRRRRKARGYRRHRKGSAARRRVLVNRRRGYRYETRGAGGRALSVPEQHQLRVARQTLRYSDAGARIMGGPTKAEAREIIARLTGRKASGNPFFAGSFEKAKKQAQANADHFVEPFVLFRDSSGNLRVERVATAGTVAMRDGIVFRPNVSDIRRAAVGYGHLGRNPMSAIVARALRESVVDVGQLSVQQRKELSAAVKAGVLQKGKGGGFSVLKTVFAAPGVNLLHQREDSLGYRRPTARNPGSGINDVHRGDVVKYLIYAGMGRGGPEYKPTQGRVYMRGPAGWVVAQKGREASPNIVDEKNFLGIVRRGR